MNTIEIWAKELQNPMYGLIAGPEGFGVIIELQAQAKQGMLDEEALDQYWSTGKSKNPLVNLALATFQEKQKQERIIETEGQIIEEDEEPEPDPRPVRIPTIRESMGLLPGKPLMGITVDFPFKPLALPEKSTLIVAEEPLQARIISTIITSAQQSKDQPIIFYYRSGEQTIKLNLESGKRIYPLRDDEIHHVFNEAQQRTLRINRQIRYDPIIVILQNLDYVVNHTKSEIARNLGITKELNARGVSFVAAITPIRYQQLLANPSFEARNFCAPDRQFANIAWGNVLGRSIAQAAGPLAAEVQTLSPSKFILTSNEPPKTYWAPR